MENEVVYPPRNHIDQKTVFLAGSIDQGRASDWQRKLISMLKVVPNLAIYNPRRPDWDASWTDDSLELNKQIKWELDHLRKADFVFMFFEAGSKSPITLLELGLFSSHPGLVVFCEPGYERFANVRIVCEVFGVKMVPSFECFVSHLTSKI